MTMADLETPAMLDFDDIQHILLMRVPALTGRYEFLSFRTVAGGRAWLSASQISFSVTHGRRGHISNTRCQLSARLGARRRWE
jgi:hypothetical protein